MNPEWDFGLTPNRRVRSTGADMLDRRAALLDIVEAQKPMTVRQVFYQATIRGIVEKTESCYVKVQRALADMRRDGTLSYASITDGTRYRRHPSTFSSIEDALENTARFYRKALWDSIDAYVEVWCEKDALSGVIYPITSMFDVSLMTARGYASLSFLASAAEEITAIGKPTSIYHLGDYDPSGQDAARKIEETLRDLAPDADIYFERLALTPAQIAAWNLPTRPTKTTDTRARNFGDDSVELDALPPDTLRQLVQEAIEQHLPPHEFKVLKAAEESERTAIKAFVRRAS